MANAVESLLPGGEEVEILIVDDGSSDRTAQIADDYEKQYPGIVRAIHQENGGHGDAVMTGLKHASGLYYKVVDSDDWLDREAYPKVLEALRSLTDEPVDMLISNYIYDKAGAKHKHVTRYRRTLPRNRVFGWDEAKRFRKGHYMLMHSVIYRTGMLRECGISLPKHTFYVDDLYVYFPLPYVERMYYVDEDLYHYYIGREGQSVQEEVMTRRIDQVLQVKRLMVSCADPFSVKSGRCRSYMLNFLEIVMTVASVLLIKSGTEESQKKKKELWEFIQKNNPQVYQTRRRRLTGRLTHLPGRAGRALVVGLYRICRLIFGFN